MSIQAHLYDESPHKPAGWGRADWWGILSITVLWVIMVALVNPVGDFPLNDDWAYAASVKTLMDSGHFVFPDWSAANIFTQIVWGSLFGSLFGFSFTVLRASTITLGLIGLIAAYKLLREMSVSTGASIFCVMVIAVNPIYFASSNTFMTDVPFFAFSSIALLFLARAINKDNASDIFLGTVAAGLALLVRQLGFAIPMAFAIASLVGNKLSLKNIVKASIPLVVCVILQTAFETWLRLDGQTPTMYGYQIQQIQHTWSQPILTTLVKHLENFLYVFMYLGVFILPILLLITLNQRVEQPWRRIGLLLVAFTIAWMGTRLLGILHWPLLENIVGKYGIGPLLQYGSTGYEPYLKGLLHRFWNLVGFLSIASVGVMTFVIYRLFICALRDVKTGAFWSVRLPIFFGATTITYLLPVIGVEKLFDRYLLLPTFTTILLLLSHPYYRPTVTPRGFAAASALFMIIIIGVITVSATHDYLCWNRVRWRVLNEMVYVNKIAPTRIDGGFEFNGMYLYDPKKIKPGAKGWWVTDNEYVIAIEERRLTKKDMGYVVEARYPVDSWLPFSPQYIYVLHKP